MLFQILSYPAPAWKKRRYQYLKFFLAPKRVAAAGFDPDAEMLTISQVENPSLVNDDSNQSGGGGGGAGGTQGQGGSQGQGAGGKEEKAVSSEKLLWPGTK